MTETEAGQCACWETCQNDAEPDSDMCAACLSEGCPGGRGDSSREACWFWESHHETCRFESLFLGCEPCAECPGRN